MPKATEKRQDIVDESLPIPSRSNLKERISEEFKRFLVIFLYLWVVFGLLSLHKSIVLSQHHVDYQENTFAFINAFVFAKVLLIAEYLQLGRRFSNKPLIYPILYKCFIFTVVLVVFHIVETTVLGVWHGNTIADSLPPMLGWNPKGLLAVSLMCFILLLPFFGFRERWGSRSPSGRANCSCW
jgi:magnesium-transporting ATPase (P-type)